MNRTSGLNPFKGGFSFRNLSLLLVTAVFMLSSASVFAEANYVYHERTNDNPGCGANAYVNDLNPTSSEPVVLAWKVEYQFYTTNSWVYYTTDGSNPTGAFGVGSGTTQVVSGSYNCTFGGPVVDVLSATIPAQPNGTVVKYIIGAWHSGGGAEIFANGPGAPCGGCGPLTDDDSEATVFTYSVTNVLNVNTGEYFSTIQAAIDDAQTLNGHTITVDAGTYQEALAITKAIALQGPNASISPNGGARVPEAIIDLTTGTRSIRMFSSNVNIIGFEIRNSANAGAIIAGQFNEVNSNPTNVVIERNYFHDLNGSAIVHFAPPSSAAWTVNDNRIENVTEGAYYGGTYGSGVQFWTGANCVVTNNVISNVAHYGIHLGNISNSTFNGNHISNCNGAAIQGFGTFNGNTFSDNELVRSSLPLSTDGIRILSAPTSITITNNYIAGYANGVLIGAGQAISGTFTLTNNNLAGNTYGLYHGGTGTVSAPCNWWGEVCSTVSQKVFGPVTLETILNSGTDTEPALRGFQPAAGTCRGVPLALVLTATPSATSCSVPTGTVSLSASGGTPPYTYGGDAISGLAAGTYTYTVIDNLGCNASATATITNQTTSTPEVCDGIDNDCDGSIDEDLVFMNYYADADGDGFGNPSESVSSCTAPSGYVVDNTDCNDNNAAINPGAAEVCDGIDNNCDGLTDALPTPITVGSASASPTLCIFAELTPITHTTAGATGIGSPSGLPPGVTALWASNTITISGTPTTAGTFNYSIPLAGGCVTVNATGTITVIMLPVIISSVSSASCPGVTDGGIELSVDGSGPFTYQWSPGGAVTANLSGITDGTYSVTVTGASGCFSVSSDIVVSAAGTLVSVCEDADGDTYGNAAVSTTYCSVNSLRTTTNLIVDGSFEDQAALQNLPGYVPPSAPTEVWGAPWGGSNWGWSSWQPIDGNGVWTGSASIARTEEFAAGWKRARTGNVFGILKENGTLTQTFSATSDGVGTLYWYDANRASWREHDWFGRPHTYSVTVTDDLGNVQQLGTYTSVVAGGTNYSTPLPLGGYGWWTTQGKNFWFARSSADFEMVAGRTYTLTFTSEILDDDRTTFFDDISISSRSMNDIPEGFSANCSDCDDTSSSVNPGITTDLCNSVDDDCDGQIDEDAVIENYYADADGDGFGNPSESVSSCIAPSGYVLDNTDCNDNDAAINPGAAEVCDGIDNDCDGSIDEDLVFMNYYADADGDGFGNPSESVSSCTAPSGYVVDNTDCNDNDAAINPGAAEVCNGIDDNCDGLVDNDLIFLTYYVDADGDGFGSASATGVSSCSAIAGSVTNNSDCNDTPGIPMNMPYNLSSLPGYGSVTSAVFYFSPGGWAGQSVPAGKVVLGATIIAGGSIANFAVFRPAGPGESFPHYTYGSNEYGWVMQANSGQAIAGVQIEVYYADSQPNYAILSSPGTLFYNGSGGYGGLSAPAGHIVSGGGYSFNNAYSSASVSALGVAGSVWPHATIGAGEQAWIVSGPFNGNSNPGRIYLVSLTPPVNQGSAINPDAVEVCDGIDNDCDGQIDEDAVFENYYADADGDGFGNPSESVSSCTAPSGYVVDNTDCNDNNAAINPGAAEVCDGIDNNCDGLTDALPTPITVGSASASPTLCIFAELTPITHTTAGATGIGSPSGLPPGVTALWASNTITISGTPTTAGTFNYSIPLAGGCETVNATGTITVIMLPVIISSVSSASCPGVTDGGIELSVDGTGPFTYQWSPGGAVTANLSGITDGTYSVTVTGASGCSSVSSDIVVSAAGSLVSVCEDADGDTFGNAAESTTYCSVNSLRTTTNLIVDGSFEDQAALQNLPGYVPPSAPTEVWGAPWGGSNWGWSSWQPIDGNGVWTGSASIARTEEFAAGWKRARTGNVFGILKENGTLTQTFSATSDGVGTLYWYDANRASWREHDWFGRPHTYSVTVTDDLGNVQQLGTYTSVVAGGTNYSTPLPLGGYGWWTTQGKNFWFARSSADFEMVAGRTYTLTFNSEILNDDRTTFFDDISISLRSMNDIPEGFSANCSDCDDTNGSVNPGITSDLCNNVDDDCDGQIDEDAVFENYYADADGDGFGNPSESVSSCTAPSGYVVDNTDCNDNNAAINPGSTEVCDGIDNDCDGSIDGDAAFENYYADADGDGFGNPSESVSSCTAPSGYVVDNTDCNDSNAAINPGATEVCDGIDNDCDGQIDEDAVFENYYADADGDGFGNPSESVSSCTAPSGYVVDNTDCNDNNAAINPGATEVCDGLDNDCDGLTDTGSCIFPGCTYPDASNYNSLATVDDGSCEYDGCTDVLALNYNPLATYDDGSCVVPVYGCTYPSAPNYNPLATFDNGTCLPTLIPGCTDVLALNYHPSATLEDGSCDYAVPGCTNADASNYNSLATVDDGSCTYEGCTDALALNYNPLATNNDGSCDYAVPGCTNADASNYNALATEDDGSCIYVGCTDVAALNYNPCATFNDGSCTYGVDGCTYPDATNFNPLATEDDGSCIFDVNNGCKGDFNDDGVIGVSDLLNFIATYGTTCQ
jgi:hypothetical protein